MGNTGANVSEKIRGNIRLLREEERLSQRELGQKAGKSGSAIQGYESGETDIPLSALITISEALGVSINELVNGMEKKAPETKKAESVELRTYIQEERLNVAAILVKNGYKVSQGKRRRTKTGKTLDYFLAIEECADPVDTSI